MLTHIEMLIRTTIRYRQRQKELLAQRWYRNLAGGLTHPHCLASFSKKELWDLAKEDIAKEREHSKSQNKGEKI